MGAGRHAFVPSSRDEACSFMVEIARMGPAEFVTAGLPDSGEGLQRWCGRHGGGANGTHAVPADLEIEYSLRMLRSLAAMVGV